MDNRAIGVFDSGLGGLTVLKELKKQMPNEDFIYFGDTKRVPYGSKDKETIERYSKEIVDFLIEKDVKLIVIACNTVSSQAMDSLKIKTDLPILGTISPGVRASLEKTQSKNILLIATEATVKSGTYENKIKSLNKDIEIHSVACPKFVPMIEDNLENTTEMQNAVKEYLEDYANKNIDTIILGCTHYPYIENDLCNVFKNEVEFVNPAVELAIEAKKFLEDSSMQNLSKKMSRATFYVSGDIEKFKRDGSRHLEEEIIDLYKKEFD